MRSSILSNPINASQSPPGAADPASQAPTVQVQDSLVADSIVQDTYNLPDNNPEAGIKASGNIEQDEEDLHPASPGTKNVQQSRSAEGVTGMKPTSDNSSIRKRPLSDHRQLSSAVPYDAGLARGTQPHDVAGPSMAHQADGQGHGSAIEPRPRTPKNVTRHPLKEDESGAQMETRSLAGSTASTGTGRLKKPRSKRAPERPKTRFDVNTDADNNKDSDNARHDVFAVVPSPPKGRKTAGKATSAIKKGPARKNARKSQRGSGQSAKGKTQKPGMDAKYQQASTVIKQRPSAVPTTRARAAKVKTEVEAVASPVKANGDATAIKRTTRASEAGNVQEETYEQFESEVIAFPGAQPDAVSHGDVAGSSQQNAIELASASESELEKEGPIPAPRANESNIRRNQIEGSGSMPHTPYRSSPPDVLGPINGQHYRPVLHEASARKGPVIAFDRHGPQNQGRGFARTVVPQDDSDNIAAQTRQPPISEAADTRKATPRTTATSQTAHRSAADVLEEMAKSSVRKSRFVDQAQHNHHVQITSQAGDDFHMIDEPETADLLPAAVESPEMDATHNRPTISQVAPKDKAPHTKRPSSPIPGTRPTKRQREHVKPEKDMIRPPQPSLRSSQQNVRRRTSSQRVDLHGSPIPANMNVTGHLSALEAFSQQQRSNSDTGGSSSVGRDLPSIPPRPDKRSGDISSNTKVQPAVPGLDSQAITGIEVEGIVQRAAQSAQEEAPRTDPFAFPDGQPDIMATPRKVTKLMQTLGREVKEKDLSKSSRPSRKPGNRMAYKFLWEHQNATKELAEEKRMLVEEQREAIEELEDAERTLVEEQSNLDLVGGMASSSSCTSASDFAESVDSQESITSQEARESWRASLNAHQSTLFDALVGISHRLVRHLVDQEIAMGDIVSDFHRRGASLVEAMKQDQENEVKDYVSAVRQAWRTMESVAKPAADSVDAAIKDVKASKAQHRGHSLRQESGLGNRLDALMQMYG